MIEGYNRGKGFNTRKTAINGIAGCLYVEVLVSYNNKVVKEVGMKCVNNLSRIDKQDLLNSAVDVAKYKAIMKLGGRQLTTAMIYERVIRNQVDVQLTNYFYRYVTTDRKIKSFTRKGKRYTGVFNTKTGRFVTYQRWSSKKDF